MDEKELYNTLGFIKVSQIRTKTLKSIGDELKMPSEIAKETKITTSQVSGALNALKKRNLVICINEDVRKGRLYKTTDYGKKIIGILNKKRME